jgi:hypothetical protein
MSGNYVDQQYHDNPNDGVEDDGGDYDGDPINNNEYADYDDPRGVVDGEYDYGVAEGADGGDPDDYGYEDPYTYGDVDPDADPYYDDPQQPSGDDEYYYDDDEVAREEYYDDEGRPLSMSDMGEMRGEPEYYDDEYHEEHYYYDDVDEEERRRRARRRRALCCCLILLCCLLLLLILLVIFLLSLRKDDATETEPPTYAPFVDDTDDDYFYDDDIVLAPGVVTTCMAPANRDCEKSNGMDLSDDGYRNVYDQCACEGEVYFVPQDVQDMRQLVLERVAPKFYGDNFTIPLNSCEPSNLAMLWLSSCDNRDSGEPRQRLAAALTYYQLNGTIWDFSDGWMSDLNECLWMGLQCNNMDTLNSLALDTNNLFGEVSEWLMGWIVFFFNGFE